VGGKAIGANVFRAVAGLVLVACKSRDAVGTKDVSSESTNADGSTESVDAAIPRAADDAGLELVEAGDADASATGLVRWRIRYEHKGEAGFAPASHTSAVLSDDGSFKSWASTHATPAQTHSARTLLIEMREHGQLSTARPPDPAAGCPDCEHTEIRVTMDGVESFVNLTAGDPADPPVDLALGHHVVWKNRRAERLQTLIESIGPEREGRVTVTGKLPAEVIKRIVRQNDMRWRACWVDASRHGLSGTVTVRFVIDRSGSASPGVQDPAAVATDISDTGFVDCVVATFGRLSFPQPDEGTVTVVYQTVFVP
jgi:hypothetical protein